MLRSPVRSRAALSLLPFAVLTVGASCSLCETVASERVDAVEFEAVAATVLVGKTHNGDITLRAGSEPGLVRGTARLVGRGETQEAADAVLARMLVFAEADGDRARIGLAWTEEPTGCESGAVHFDLEIPPGWSLELDSHNGDLQLTAVGAGGLRLATHNGDVQLEDVAGDVRFDTHNGRADIQGETRNVVFDSHNGDLVVEAPLETLEAESHNGSVRLRATGQGPLAGSIETHNGDVRLDAGGRTVRAVLGSRSRVSVAAEGATVYQADDEHATVLAGPDVTPEGEQLRVRTYNGSIDFRAGGEDR